MRDINQQYQIDHDSEEMWIAHNLWEERENDRAHSVPGLPPLDVDEGIVEQAKFMGIHIMRKAELKNASNSLLKRAFMIQVHHCGDGNTVPTERLIDFQDMLT